MNSVLIIFSVIVLANAKPSDYNDQFGDASTSVSGESDEQSSIPDTYPVSVYTKYPDDPNDSYKVSDEDELPPLEETEEARVRRQTTDCNGTDPSIDVNKQLGLTDDVKRPERKIEDQSKIPLRGFISAIESDLFSRALNVNSKLRRRRSTERIVDDDDVGDNDDDDDSKEIKNNNNVTDDSVDVNKNFFEGLFNYTRPLRETEEKDVRIPLNGLVSAVETSLVNAALNLKDAKHSKREASNGENPESSTEEPNESHRIYRDTTDDQEPKKEPEIKVAKLDATSSVDLHLLNPIALKAVTVTTEEPNQSGEEGISTTENPIQSTNLTVIQASNKVSLVPGADKKLAHVQHQKISKTVFQSSLAIFPTIPPSSINAPLPHFTTTEEPIETTVAPKTDTSSSTTVKSEQQQKHDQLLQKAQKLKEKFAEIAAEPVILSQF
ncbi:uncharacterized protein LOC129579282 [Sitodiplosis mosellana]|uniref:uncharacterized protein LOC129579282 n=1 Tax=Sitodiplosis mosellana TaxID=263140 RepID=UPI002443DCE1|nr:uncharacterized protein LOC129579282 [Sitodiplosis mosellana]